jgi:chromosome segregation ATPase
MELIQIQFKDFVPIILGGLAVLGGSGVWGYLKYLKGIRAKSGITEAQEEEIIAKVNSQKVDNEIKISEHSLKILTILEHQLEASRKREEVIQSQLDQAYDRINGLEESVSELQIKLNEERKLRMRVEHELTIAKEAIEARDAPGRNREIPR